MGPICSTCVHSQIHLHYILCAKFIPNRSSRLTTFPMLLNCWPPKKSPNCRRGVSRGELFLAYVHSQMNPQTCTEFRVNRFIRLAALPDLNLWPTEPPPPQCPLGYCGRLVFSLCPWSSSLTASTYFLICDPLKPQKCPPGILRGELYLAYVHSQTNPQTCTKCGANRSSCLQLPQTFEFVTP